MSQSRVSRALTPVLAGVVVLGLSGCAGGVTQAGTGPGTAARVGDVEISRQEVDRAARAICADLEQQFEETGSPVAMGQVRQYALSLLAARAQGEQVAAQYDVEAGPEVAADLQSWREQAERVPDDLVDDFAEVRNTEALLTSLLTGAGRAALQEEGVAEPTDQEAAERGSDLFSQWAEQADIEIDPRYGLDVVDGVLEPGDTEVSVPVSAAAVAAWAEVHTPEEADGEHAAGLPTQQRCG